MISLSNYTIAREIQRGADVVLHAGHRKVDQVPVLLKTPRAEVPTPRQIARLRHELAILADLPIPGVLQALDLEVSEDGAALIFEGFDGQPLRQVALARRLDLGQILRIAVSLAGTLAAVHGRRVIHKAIQPGNVLLSEVGEVKLLDFSAASRLPEEYQEIVSPRALEGSVAYLAPEQTGRMSCAIDRRADLYSLGVTLYELLAQGPPFSATDPAELVHSHIARTPPSPRDLSPDVPAVVSDIVMKLLAKAPEHRYQSAAGLRADLEECQRQWAAKGGIEAFPLGHAEIRAELLFPRRLYGRGAEIERLAAAFDRAAGGAAELLLLSGASGAGKSTLAHEIHRSIAENRRGLFAAGRFERIPRGAPHAALMRPFRSLCRQILAERAEVLADYRARLVGALSQSGQALIDVIPELAKIIGPQPRVPAVAPSEAKNRFSLLFQGMVRVFAAPDHPLVLFLDDLQWAAPASIDLLEIILSDPEGAHLLVIGACRDHEVGADHPLKAAVEKLERAAVTITPIHLGQIEAPDVVEIVADTLGCAADQAEPLAAIAVEKTRGEPLFLRQLLRALPEAGLLTGGAGAWTYDPAAIRAAKIPDDGTAFVAEQIEELAPATRRAVELAACIGHEVDLRTLAAIADRSQFEAAGVLWPALTRGLLVPSSAEYRLVHTGWGASLGEVPPSLKVSYRFSHDRVREAAYARLGEVDRPQIHLRIGRLFYRDRRGDTDESALFDVVEHLNLGAALLTDPGERLDLARMNLAAGRRAKARAAYATAAAHFEAGAAMLTEPSWEDEHDLAFALHAEQAECEHLSGRFAQADALFDALLSRARGSVEIARVHGLRVSLHAARGQAAEALRAGRTALALFGIELPEDARAAADAELAEVSSRLASRPIAELLAAPEMESPEHRAALRILVSLMAPAALTSEALHTWVVAKQVNLSLAHGHSDASPHGYMAYAAIAARRLSRHEEAHAVGRLALDLNERFGGHELTCKLSFVFGASVDFFTEHLRSSLEYLRRAQLSGIRTGDFQHFPWACVSALALRLSLGDGCLTLREEVERSQALLGRVRDESSTLGLLAVRQAIANLTGATRGRHTLSDGAFEESAFEAKLGAAAPTVGLLYFTLKLSLAYLYEDHHGALRIWLRCEDRLADGAFHYLATELVYYACLTLTAVIPSSADEDRRRYEAMLAGALARLALWASLCPDNFRHKHLLVLAEQARAEGDELSAMKLYDQAIESARKSEFSRDEALAGELAAKFHLMSGRQKIAGVYMVDAYHGYLRWGASAKVEQLIEKHPALLAQPSSPAARGAEIAPQRAEGLDLLAATRALRAISSEMLLDKLVDRLLRILIESAGAQRGALVLSRDGRLMVEATITVASSARGKQAKLERVERGAPVPIEAGDAVPAAIVRHVARTQEPIVLRDAAADDRFSGDPYITERRPRSVMCLAMTHQGRLTGALYLEHSVAFGAFGPAKVELCDLLASHAAIAVENAILYGTVQEATSALQQTNELLEDEVKRRTEELRAANERLSTELANGKRAQEEREALQEEIIRVQQARLLELSTPLIPITDRVMVLPLIGEVDAARSMQVMEATLQGVQARRAEVVIVDVTGAKAMNNEVAHALIRTSNAVRLLGAQVVLTGLRPQAAMALVELGVDLGGVLTLGTLQDAIGYALKRTANKRRAR